MHPLVICQARNCPLDKAALIDNDRVNVAVASVLYSSGAVCVVYYIATRTDVVKEPPGFMPAYVFWGATFLCAQGHRLHQLIETYSGAEAASRRCDVVMVMPSMSVLQSTLYSCSACSSRLQGVLGGSGAANRRLHG